MKTKLENSILTAWKASEELENEAMMAEANKRSQLGLLESRLMRGRILDSQIRLARAERYILNIPIKEAVKLKVEAK